MRTAAWALGIVWALPLVALAVAALAGEAALPAPLVWGRTAAVGLGAVATAALLGLPAGLVLASRPRLAPLALVPLLFPPGLVAIASIALERPGYVPSIRSEPAAVARCALILGAVAWPVVALAIAHVLGRMPASALEAARLHLSPARTFARIVAPRMADALLAGGAVVLLLAASDHTVAGTFGMRVLATEIVERFALFDRAGGALLAAPLLGGALLLAVALLRRREPLAIRRAAWRSPAWVWAPAALAWLATAVLPTGLLAHGAEAPARTLGVYADSILWSFGVAAGVGLVAAAWAAIGQSSPRLALLEPLWVASLLVPGAALAASLAGRWWAPAAPLLGLALASRFAIVAWLPVRVAARSVSDREREAAWLSGLSAGRTWRRLLWPAVRGSAVFAAAVVAILALGDVGATAMLSPPGRTGIAAHVYALIHYGYSGTVASLSLVVVAAAWLAAGAAVVVWRRA